jgi:hypothetical protein
MILIANVEIAGLGRSRGSNRLPTASEGPFV